MKKVSVIVPVYKVEKYLAACVDSICNQTYTNLEIILVDDGSPDMCGKICDEYRLRDERIIVVHKDNEGLGKARNSGLEVATGDFICFVDSDDWIVESAIECWVAAQSKYNADIVMCNFDKVNDAGKVLYEYRITTDEREYIGDSVQKEIFWQMIGRSSDIKEDFTVNMCVWTNLYKREIIERERIRFLSEREYLSEDICFNLQYLLSSNVAVMIPDALYRYRFNPMSLTNHYKEDEYKKACNLYEQVKYWANNSRLTQCREFRIERFFITKVRELLFRLCSTSITFSEKRNLVKDILNDINLCETLNEYPVCNYTLKYRIPALLMKYKQVNGVILLFTIANSKRKLAY